MARHMAVSERPFRKQGRGVLRATGGVPEKFAGKDVTLLKATGRQKAVSHPSPLHLYSGNCQNSALATPAEVTGAAPGIRTSLKLERNFPSCEITASVMSLSLPQSLQSVQ